MSGLYLQYGCGLSSPEGWLNFDASPTMRLQRLPVVGGVFRKAIKPLFPRGVRFGDVRRGLPVADGTADGVYCSHVLEHLAFDDCIVALKESYRVLKPGGRFRLVMPDLRLLVDKYVATNSSDAAHELMKSSMLGQRSRPVGTKGLLRSWLGNAEHRWLWDYPAIAAELAKVGFTEIRRASFNDSADKRFAEVEERERWDNNLGAECVRPGKKG